jgi:hypothetical protein
MKHAFPEFRLDAGATGSSDSCRPGVAVGERALADSAGPSDWKPGWFGRDRLSQGSDGGAVAGREPPTVLGAQHGCWKPNQGRPERFVQFPDATRRSKLPAGPAAMTPGETHFQRIRRKAL